MKLSAVIASLAAAGSVFAAPPAGSKPFEITALRSASPIHFTTVGASQSNIFLNLKDQGAVCKGKCKDRKGTATFYLKNGILYLYTKGGLTQKVFLDRSGFGQGKMGYLTGDGPLPRRFEVEGWNINAAGNLDFKGKGLLACPSSDPKITSWTVWVDAGITNPGGNQNCLGFSARTTPSKKPQASTPESSARQPERGCYFKVHFEEEIRSRAEERRKPASSMDSDEEFMTDASSPEEFLDTQGSDDESLGDDFEDDLGGSFTYEKDIKPVQQPYETDSTTLSPGDITREQNVQINEVSSILGLPSESAAILLRFSRWNREKLIESYMDHPEKTLEEAGLGSTFSLNPKTEVMPGFMCEICCEDGSDLQTYAMRCGHRFCVDCYSHYLGQKIKEEGEAARIECPQDQCHRIVDSKSLGLLVSEELRDRYRVLLIRTYVDDMPNLKWCPAPNCEYAVRCGVKERDLNRIVPTVYCTCTFGFCFGCDAGDHQPCPCSLVKKWVKKCKDDSETANWISANTKECSKCHSTIEKNGGCNHMTCRKCKHEFCWMCLGPWSEHGTSWYNCNRYEEKGGTDSQSSQTRSRQSLERYLHYYNRFANHEQSAKLDRDLFLKTEKMMVNLQSQSGLSWIEVQFLDTASKTLQECRQTLKWTYAFAFYLARNNLTEIFEDNQRDLEMAVENLSEMFERPISELAGLKVDILDKTAYCNKRRVILLSDTAENLKAGEWSFIVDLK
ncbi:hypothetical protein FQN49_002751 [Arthroderma sp. PD_2]|nr:hypothetical protein FQN49_002751 [Arthroderma sp. PD_2]